MSKHNSFAIGFIYTLSYFLILGKGYYFNTNSKTLLIVGVSMMLLLLLINKYQKRSLYMLLKLNKCPKIIIKIISILLMIVLFGEISRIMYHFSSVSGLVYQRNIYGIVLMMIIIVMIYFQKLAITKTFKLILHFFPFIIIVLGLILTLGFNNMEMIPFLSLPLKANGMLETFGMILVIGYLLFWIDKNAKSNVLWGSLGGIFVLSVIFYINESVFRNLNQDLLSSTIKLGSTYNLCHVISNVDIIVAVAFFIIEVFKISILYRLILKLFLNVMENSAYLSAFVFFTMIIFILTGLFIPQHLPLFMQAEKIINLLYILGGGAFLLIF